METLVFGHFVSTSPWSFLSASESAQPTSEREDTPPQPVRPPETRKPTPTPATVSAPEAQPPDEPIVVVLPLF